LDIRKAHFVTYQLLDMDSQMNMILSNKTTRGMLELLYGANILLFSIILHLTIINNPIQLLVLDKKLHNQESKTIMKKLGQLVNRTGFLQIMLVSRHNRT
jgi:hypothetical protein